MSEITPLTPEQIAALEAKGLTVLPQGTPPRIDGYRIAWCHHERRWVSAVAHIDTMLRQTQ